PSTQQPPAITAHDRFAAPFAGRLRTGTAHPVRRTIIRQPRQPLPATTTATASHRRRPAMKIGSLFSGYGGLDIAVESFFHARTVWHAEFEDAPSKVLAHHWPGIPNLHDVSLVDWSAVEPVDIITGGFPCQDVSLAGRRAGMTEGTRSNLWGAMRTAIETIRPQYAVIENVRGLLSATAQSDSDLEQRPGFMGDEPNVTLRAIGRVLGDLADIGYDAQWHGLRAADIGAPHNRPRVFILATNTDSREPQRVGELQGLWRRPDTRADMQLQTVTNTTNSGQSIGTIDTVPKHTGATGVRSGIASSTRSTGPHSARVAWGAYEPAIRRWETIIGRPAPAPTEPTGRDGKPQISAKLTEWMMGLDEGWVTGVPGVSRANQIKMCGNGVVPQQALAALQHMQGGSSWTPEPQ